MFGVDKVWLASEGLGINLGITLSDGFGLQFINHGSRFILDNVTKF